MSNKKTTVSLTCLKCKDSITMEAEDIELKIPAFSAIHKLCGGQLEGFIGQRSIGLFVQGEVIKENYKFFDKKVLN